MFKKLFRQLNQNKVRQEKEYDLELSSKLSTMVESIRNVVGESDDVFQRDILIGHQIPAALFYIDGLCDEKTLEENIVEPLMYYGGKLPSVRSPQFIDYLKKELITLASLSVYDSYDEAILSFMSGRTLLVIDGLEHLIVLYTIKFKDRSIEEPQSEVTIRGPRDGFIETLQTNVMLLRRRIRDPNLTIQMGEIGRRSKRPFAICYIKGITNEELIEEVRYRIACVDNDDVPATGSLEEFIQDNLFSPFPQLLHTERPDRGVRALLNGQVVILIDGTPFAVFAPSTLHQLLKSPEDYYERFLLGSLIRLLRYGAAFIALFLPALYVAAVSFHQGMIPTTLALSIAGAREGVPFPSFIEAIVMEATFELLREAGTRLPRPVGQTVGVVGGLIIGEAAVRAGIVSPVMVIVVALTAIANFAIPVYTVAISFRMLRFVLMIMAAFLGLYGIIIVYIMINIHIVGLRSFGSYYTSPYAPYYFRGWMDSMVRFPWTVLRKRTLEPKTKDEWRQPPRK